MASRPLSKTSFLSLLLTLTVNLSCGRLAGRNTPSTKEADRRASSSLDGASAMDAEKEPSATAAEKAPSAKSLPPLKDKGIFSDLDPKVVLKCPAWLEDGPFLALHSRKTGRTWLAVDGVVICEAAAGSPQEKDALLVKEISQDGDRDGIPDAVDILRGAKKTALNGASYKNNYRELAFPDGDVPREEGVCTDVVIRALRNAGTDLQELLSLDLKARPTAYPMVKKSDPHIDHRRVKTLLPFFENAFESLPIDPRDSAFPYLPGDIVLMNTMGDSAPEHLGIVSDEVGASGLPMIINNWTEGTVTRAMDLLRTVPVTHRFRAFTQLQLDVKQQGLAGILARHELTIPSATKQVLLVTTPLWKSSGGTLRRFERTAGGFQQVGQTVRARVGGHGLASGRGVSGAETRAPTSKKEGDKKAPAGVFDLGTAFGRNAKAPYKGKWPYRTTTPKDFWIDDPKSPKYNQWFTLPSGELLAWSAERLEMYALGLVVEHNTAQTVPGAGSAIFLHAWRDEKTPTVGCTAVAPKELESLLAWLDPKSKPVLVQVAGHVF